MGFLDATILAVQCFPMGLLVIALAGGIRSKRRPGDPMMFFLVVSAMIACSLIFARLAYLAAGVA